MRHEGIMRRSQSPLPNLNFGLQRVVIKAGCVVFAHRLRQYEQEHHNSSGSSSGPSFSGASLPPGESPMDDLHGLTRGQRAALVFAFLQADCAGLGYEKELLSLAGELNLFQDLKSNGSRIDYLDDGALETDGHLPGGIAVSLDDILPSVDQWPRGHVEAAAFLQVAEGLREIAAQLEQDVVARGIQNLNSHVSVSPSEQWRHHLAHEVERAMRQGVGLDHLPQERVLMALTLTLVRGVCVQAPRLVRGLFAAALQLISPAR